MYIYITNLLGIFKERSVVSEDGVKQKCKDDQKRNAIKDITGLGISYSRKAQAVSECEGGQSNHWNKSKEETWKKSTSRDDLTEESNDHQEDARNVEFQCVAAEDAVQIQVDLNAAILSWWKNLSILD